MNAVVRAVARTAFAWRWEVVGIEAGYKGLLEGHFRSLGNRGVGGILQRGGTVLGTARSTQFATPEGQATAAKRLQKAGVEGLVVIGGDGSLTGALRLQECGVKVVGIPATIDNDVFGTDTAVGVDTALNTAIAGGAEVVLVPEFEAKPQEILQAFSRAWEQGKPHFIVVAAEGAPLSAEDIHKYINDTEGAFESRLTVLGHVQRGGSPTAFDRILASRMGTAAVKALSEAQSGMMIGLRGRRTEYVALNEVVGQVRPLDADLYEMAEVLAGFPEEISYR